MPRRTARRSAKGPSGPGSRKVQIGQDESTGLDPFTEGPTSEPSGREHGCQGFENRQVRVTFCIDDDNSVRTFIVSDEAKVREGEGALAGESASRSLPSRTLREA